MDSELTQKLIEQSTKIDAVYASVEKTRKYFLIIIWITILGLLLPLVGILFTAPSFINSYTASDSASD